MKTLNLILAIPFLFLTSCTDENRFKAAIRDYTQTDKEVSIVMIDSITFREMWHEDRDIYLDLYNSFEESDTNRKWISSQIHDLTEMMKTDRAKGLAGYRIIADLGSDRVTFITDSAISKIMTEEEYLNP